MIDIPQTIMPMCSVNLQQECPAPAGARLRSASALRKAGRTAQGRFVMDPTHGCCREICIVFHSPSHVLLMILVSRSL